MPALADGMVLVENKFSLISSGTERSTVKVAQSNLFGKAKHRPDLVAQVLQNIRKEGIKATYQKVRTKLDSLKALGYSTSGTVIMSLSKNDKLKAGDRVACAGQDYASHAEIVAVPQNLVVKIPDNVSFEEAAFTTLGAIAMQGVRQAEPRIGENVCVIGLGLLGQLTGQILKANGCNVFGIDISDSLVDLASHLSTHKALNRMDSNLIAASENFTRGIGFDSIIITAATASNDPVVLATEISRKKGKIIIVGAVKMDIPREPFFYKKEMELKISCSYGPGRYDVSYEEGGQDYPVPYVRWTEQRNMEAFLEVVSKGLVNLTKLITHVFDINQAEQAYDLVLGRNSAFHIGILLKYLDNEKKFITAKHISHSPSSEINAGFIGAGSFAQSYLIPNVKAFGASLDTVVTSKGITSKNVGQKFGFNTCSTDINNVLDRDSINAIFIATPHVVHAEQVVKALQSKKYVFVEKPLAINEEELNTIISTKEVHNYPLMVGYNRRFSPLAIAVKKAFANASEPLVVNIRINAGFVAKEHWTQLSEIGAGRIIGEICHFVDLMQYFTDAEPQKVYADCISTDNSKLKSDDNISIIIKFSNGSIGNLTYVANGDKSLPKEHIEVFGASKVGVINDFRSGIVFGSNKQTNIRLSGKGHQQEIEAFLQAVKSGGGSPIDFRSICLTSLTTFKILDSLRTGLPQEIHINV